MLPKATDGGFHDVEARYRKRHLDLILHNNVRDIFVTRSKVVNYVRKYLDSLGFLEVSLRKMSLCVKQFHQLIQDAY